MRGLWLLAAVLLTGCSTIPESVRQAPANSPSPAVVREAPANYRGEQVRWGGAIAEVINREQNTLIAVVDRPLDSGARPRADASSRGRFLARVPGFVDPAVYTKDREITVVGRIDGTSVRSVGDYRYTYPVVDVTGHQLWPPRREIRAVSPPPGWYPSYSPFSPWGHCHDPWGWDCHYW